MRNNTINDIIKFLGITPDPFLVGSYLDYQKKILLYPSDIDVHDDIDMAKYSVHDILKAFKNKFKMASKQKIWIMDFKCGFFHQTKLRWSETEIRNGYKMIGNTKIKFIDTLRQKSIIKIDIIAYASKKFTEFSCNYLLNYPDGFTTNPVEKAVREKIYVQSYYDNLNEDNPMKAIKRLYSLYKLNDNPKIKVVIKFLNGPTGKLNYFVNWLKLLEEVIMNSKKPDINDIKGDLKKIRDKIGNKYNLDIIINKNSLGAMLEPLGQAIYYYDFQVKNESYKFILLKKLSSKLSNSK